MFQHSYKMSYKFQEIDERDHLLSHDNESNTLILKTRNNTEVIKNLESMPLKLNLYRITNPINILDQGKIGSCVSNSFALNISYITNNSVNICRLLHYALCRIRDNTALSDDSGTTIRLAGNVINSYGTCSESLYPYSLINVNNYHILPPLNTLQNSKLFRLFRYNFVQQNLNSIKACLNTYKTPIIFGFMVYSSFMTQTVAKTGIAPMPVTSKEVLQGGHCMNIVGYDDIKKVFICANSWGTTWGDKGFCYMPYDYIINPSLARDLCFLQVTI